MRYNHFSMLPERAFQPRGGFRAGGMTLEGGSPPAPPPAPTSTSQTTIPEYAKPYMERLLGKAEAASEAPYQTYGGERLVGATPEQQAARSGVAGLQQPGAFPVGTQMAAGAGLGALGLGTQAAGAGQQYMGLATSPQAQQMFMSPYMQNVVDVQRREAIRSAQMGNLAQNLGAARQGTYGGARQLLAQTERERNLGQQLAQIQATGSQKAFEAAQQAQQFGSELGLRGLQTGLQGFGQATQAGAALGQLGTAQQQADLARLQAQESAGALTQRDRQAALDLAYQDFLAQQRYPYSQLGFMSDILRGSGNLAGTGGTALYQAPPSTGSQLLGLAANLGGAYLAGGGKFFKEGGEVSGLGAVKSYQGGGDVFEDMIDVSKLTPQQIEQTRATPARDDVPDIVLLGELEAKLAEMKRLQAGMAKPPQTTAAQDIRQEAQQVAGLEAIPVDDNYFMSEEEAMASGGIVAFAGGGMPSMDPGMPYGLGYTNNMGYENGGVVAFQDLGLVPPPVEDPTFGMTPFGGTPGIGLAQVLDRAAAEKAAAERVAPAAKKEEPAPAKKPAKPAAPKVEVSDKAVKKVQQAEDKYEKYLTKLMDDAGMAEEDKSKALGFALMKFGSTVYGARKGQEAEKISEGLNKSVDSYVGMLEKASKDKKEALKTLAEYGLAKERLGVQREQVEATRAATSESAAMRREQAAEALQQKYFAAYQDRYKNVPQFKADGTPNPGWKSFSQYMREAQVARGPETSVTAPGERPPIRDVLRSPIG